MTDHLTVVSHPLVQHKLTLMREKDTSTASFRQLLRDSGIVQEVAHLPAFGVQILDQLAGHVEKFVERASARALGEAIGVVTVTDPKAVPPAAASGDTWPMDKPDVPPEKRPSVISAQALPKPRDFK